jgi:hypothetical protein
MSPLGTCLTVDWHGIRLRKIELGIVMKWLLIVSGLVMTVPAGADDDSYEASIDGALEFAECAGLYYASADLGPEFGQSPGDVDLARGLGNGCGACRPIPIGSCAGGKPAARPWGSDPALTSGKRPAGIRQLHWRSGGQQPSSLAVAAAAFGQPASRKTGPNL